MEFLKIFLFALALTSSFVLGFCGALWLPAWYGFVIMIFSVSVFFSLLVYLCMEYGV